MDLSKWILCTFFLILPCLGCAQGEPTTHTQSIEDLLADPCFKTAGLGLVVADLDGGQWIFDRAPDLALPPASTLKIWTTAAALDLLGEDFRYKTIVQYQGTIRGDTLHGDLVIHGFGDPTLASRHFSDNPLPDLSKYVAGLVKQAGIEVILGDIIGDASYFSKDKLSATWPYQDLGNYYGSACIGLNAYDNLCDIHFQQQRNIGDLVSIAHITPAVPSLRLECFVRTGPLGSGDQAYVMGAPYQHERMVIGTIPPGSGLFKIKGSLPDPAFFLAFTLSHGLHDHGILVQGTHKSTFQQRGVPRTNLGEIPSPPLQEIIKLTNVESINLFAEGLGMRSEAVGASDSEDHFLISYWKEAGIELNGCRLSDFAGLAPDNAVTARAMVEVLIEIHHRPEKYPGFLSSLAVGGLTGTLKSIWTKSAAKGHIYAKSGSISGVRSYAGYIDTRSGNNLAFCVLTHNPACSSSSVRKKLEQLLEDLYFTY